MNVLAFSSLSRTVRLEDDRATLHHNDMNLEYDGLAANPTLEGQVKGNVIIPKGRIAVLKGITFTLKVVPWCLRRVPLCWRGQLREGRGKTGLQSWKKTLCITRSGRRAFIPIISSRIYHNTLLPYILYSMFLHRHSRGGTFLWSISNWEHESWSEKLLLRC